MIHRPGGLADAEGWAEVVAEASPYLVQDSTSETHEMQHDPPGARRWVVGDAGRVVALARLVEYDDEGHASLRLMVRPTHRRRGHARTLLEVALDHLTRPVVHSIVEDDDESRAAAQRASPGRSLRPVRYRPSPVPGRRNGGGPHRAHGGCAASIDPARTGSPRLRAPDRDDSRPRAEGLPRRRVGAATGCLTRGRRTPARPVKTALRRVSGACRRDRRRPPA